LTWYDFKCTVPTVTITGPMLWWNYTALYAMEYWSNMERYGYTVMKLFTPSEDSLEYNDDKDGDGNIIKLVAKPIEYIISK